MGDNSAQQSVLWFVLPVLATILTWGTPALVLFFLGELSLKEEARTASRSWLSLLSFVILLVSPVFLMSNYAASSLYLYGVYGAFLAAANLVADRSGKRRVWPALWVWHTLNLLSLLGGRDVFVSMTQGVGPAGIIMTAFSVSGSTGKHCGDVAWCSDAWVAIQMLASFVYIVLHVATFFVVTSRLVFFYGGETDGPGCGSFRRNWSMDAALHPQRTVF
mmetsp:Transcript_87524/g.245837  ORF Transcript_87524/g.245837 Transcript_87524/m.245837 type:complete len:219 (+) Transcript_87524:77-733(+)